MLTKEPIIAAIEHNVSELIRLCQEENNRIGVSTGLWLKSVVAFTSSIFLSHGEGGKKIENIQPSERNLSNHGDSEKKDTKLADDHEGRCKRGVWVCGVCGKKSIEKSEPGEWRFAGDELEHRHSRPFGWVPCCYSSMGVAVVPLNEGEKP